MTAVFQGGFGRLIQTQFGANEIASMITIGKSIGSTISRKSDASIFKVLEEQYGIHIDTIPSWFRFVKLDRSGYILGDKMRKVRFKSFMDDTAFETVEGIATFMTLILRFAQPIEAIVEDVEDLLRGDYGIVNGGRLAADVAAYVESEDVVGMTRLPFALKSILMSFVQGVIDTDAQSAQRDHCMTLMAKLAGVTGSRALQRTARKYVKAEHQKLLSFLFQNGKNQKPGKIVFNTLSSGAAMIALAAVANGADIIVECINGKEQILLGRLEKQHDQPPSNNHSCTIVRVWVTQPPTTILQDLKFASIEEWHTWMEDPDVLPLPVCGGEMELSKHVSRLLDIHMSPDDAPLLWQEGVRLGERAEFTTNRGRNQEVYFAYKQDFLRSNQGPADLCQRTDRLHKTRNYGLYLDRAASSVFHNIYQYNEYGSIDIQTITDALKLIKIAVLVGSIKRLISNSNDRLSLYAWTGDAQKMLATIEALAFETGISGFRVIVTAARIWGGLPPKPLETPRSGMEGESVNSIVGMVCPQMVLIINVLLDPIAVARNGIESGFLSYYEGSASLLARDRSTGFIFAADPPYTRPPFTYDPSSKELKRFSEDDDSDSFFTLIFSAEISTSLNGQLGMSLCVWHCGVLLMSLNPSTVAFGLLYSRVRDLAALHRQEVSSLTQSFKILHLPFFELSWLECGFSIANGICVVDLRGMVDWQVVAAGVIASPHVVSLSAAKEPDWASLDVTVYSAIPDGSIVFLTNPAAAPISRSELSVQDIVLPTTLGSRHF